MLNNPVFIQTHDDSNCCSPYYIDSDDETQVSFYIFIV